MRYLAILLICIPSLVHAQFINNTGIVITNSTQVFTNGDWQNSGAFTNNGTIITTENWLNSGTMNVNSLGGFILQYGESKSFLAGSNSVKLGFLQKEGGGDAAVSGIIRVTDSLKILTGKIKMNTTADTLGFASNTWVWVGNGSLVEGPMACFGTGSFVFPVGKSGQYLPIRFFNSNSSRVGVVVEDAPAGYTAGDGVESLTSFPFVWRTVAAQPTNTASYLEVQTPVGLVSGVANPIVVQKVNLINEFEGMGSRSVTSDGVNTLVRSYSSGLIGLFSIANGYPGNILIDSTELVNLYNATNGANWTNKSSWRANPVKTWFGVTEKGGRITRVEMPNNNITGTVPTSIVNMNALRVLNLTTNNITTIPDFTTIPALTSLDVSGNNLDFGSLESNAALIGINYVNQDSLGSHSYTEAPVHTNYTLSIPVGGTSNSYQWKLNGQPIPGANASTYQIISINRERMGDYILEVTNPLVPGLTLKSSNQRVLATADISGTLYSQGATPATAGKMRLLKIADTGKYDTVRIQNINNNGTYLFDNVILDDYLINAYADTALYAKAIPTYYIHTIFWEEADTLKLEDNVVALDITSEFKPDPPFAGEGVITGTFFENTPEGKMSAKARVAKAAVAVRRVEGSGGRGKAAILTLVAYIFTNDDGEFTFNKLDADEYRLNIQMPGYPMDTTSFITIPIGTTLFDRQVGVEAEVVAGKIQVRKLVITGWDEQDHNLSVYPNPSVDYLFVKGFENRNSEFRLWDTTGKAYDITSNWDEQNARWELSIQHLKRGNYILQIHRNGKTESVHVIID